VAAKLFAWLSDVERAVRRKVDQPLDEPGQPTWALEEWNQVFNDAHRHTWERISSMDRNFGVKVDDTTTVAAGDTSTALPADLRTLRKVYTLNASGKVQSVIRAASFDDLGGWCANEAAIYRPSENDLYWAVPTTKAMTLRVVYEAYPPRLPHGCVAKLSSGVFIQLASYESDDDADYNSIELLMASGTGAGSTVTTSAYDAGSKVVTVTPAITVDTDTKYTSRPALPVDAYDAFFYDCCARLVEKLQDERFEEFVVQRERRFLQMATALASLDRQETLYTRDDTELGGHGDPAYDWY
jgi:hypothetical protein